MTSEDIDLYLEMAESDMKHALDHLAAEFTKIRAGKATPAMVASIEVTYYGMPTPMNQVANIGNEDTRTLVIKPFERKILGAIEKAIFNANLGITPQNDGSVVRLIIPPLTEERRQDMAKKAKAIGEESKVGIRTARRDAMEAIKKEVKNGYPEDLGKKKEAEAQALTDRYIAKVDGAVEEKTNEVMKV
jgi:ribosome recycling factor